MDLQELNLGSMPQKEFASLINQFVQTTEQKLIYNKMYEFFDNLSNKSDDLFPMFEDIDKRREIKYILAQKINSTNDLDTLFEEMCEVVLDYDVVDEKVLEEYTFLQSLKKSIK
jgi:hypothetical protein